MSGQWHRNVKRWTIIWWRDECGQWHRNVKV
jgi:hypothetical protein